MSRPRPASVSWGRPDTDSASGTRPSGRGERNGSFLGKYRIISEIGRGGMASVHLARIDGPGGFHRWVAIKRIHPHLIDNDQVVDMFLDEARMAAVISHANVAQVFDLGKAEDSYWIAMEYLHGEPLREITRQLEERRTFLRPALAARICADAAEGLHAAHEVRGKSGQLLGLVHRDVTPHNLFVTYEGCTKVVDFGIALAAERLCAPTSHGQLKGKLAYMSPEQIRDQPVDRTTDVFALGIVLWELTTGHRLFRRESDLDTLERAQACEVPLPSSLVRGYPAELEAIVMKALSRDKAGRYPTARLMSRALQAYLLREDALVGSEEVAEFVCGLFRDRIETRNAHLRWAAEVTETHDLERGDGDGEIADDDTLTPSDDTGSDTDARTLDQRGHRTARTGRESNDLVPLGEETDDDIQTIALQLSGEQLIDLRKGFLRDPRAAAQSAPRLESQRGPPPVESQRGAPGGEPPPTVPTAWLAGSQLVGSETLPAVARPGERRTLRETPAVLVALFLATVLSVLAFAAALQWIVHLIRS